MADISQQGDESTKERAHQYRMLNVRVIVAPLDLPDLSLAPPPADGYEPVLVRMRDWALISSLAPPNQPFTFTEIGSSAPVCSSLVGEIVFKKFMHHAEVVTDQTVIPLQLRQIILQQLLHYNESLKEKHSAEKEKAQELFDAAAARCEQQGCPY